MGLIFNPEQLQQIDSEIRSGQQGKARKDLTELCRATVPREYRVQVAALARRSGTPYLGLRLLAPHVRPAGKKIGDATPKEKAEYAASLIYVGASAEALEIIRSMGSEAPVEAMLFHTFALFAQWEYGKAIPVLSEYVKSPELADYQRLVGKVNLAAALVTERQFTNAETLLTEIENFSREGNFHLLHGIILELSAQNQIFQKHWKEAEHFLTLAEEKLKGSDSWEALFVRKWRAISDSLQGKADAVNKMHAIRTEAITRGHGETVRDVDRFLSLLTRDEKLFIHVYFGTPYESFRKRLLSEADFKVEFPDNYDLQLGNVSKTPIWIDVAKGEAGPDRSSVKFGSGVHRLVKELCHDFYQGSSLIALHARVYPGEYFNPVSTPAKMHRLMMRLRDWFSAEKIPLEIIERRSNYKLSSEKACVLRLRERTTVAGHPQLDALESQFVEDKFTIRDASRHLKAPTRSTLRLLEKGMSEGRISREGRAGATRYRFLKKTG